MLEKFFKKGKKKEEKVTSLYDYNNNRLFFFDDLDYPCEFAKFSREGERKSF